MNTEFFFNSKIVENIGWTLLHSLWQIALIAFVLFVLLKFSHGFSANFRYRISVFALAFSITIPALTFYQLNKTRSTTYSNDEISKTQNLTISEKPAFMAENFIFQNENKTELTNKKSSGFLASIQNLQKDFSENISTILPFLVGFWFLGILIFGVRLVGGFRQLHIFKTREISLPEKKWQSKFAALCERLEIKQKVKFLKSELIETPVVIGFIKPVILIPASVFLQISPKELETIIAHELVHIRRADALVNFAQSFVEVLFFYHPCVWWMSSVIGNEREFAADESVVTVLENSNIVYANALANLEELRLLRHQKLTPLATAANGGNLMQRISKILQRKTEKNGVASLWSAVAAFALISAFLLTVFSFNNSPVVNAGNSMENKKLAIGFVSIKEAQSDEAYQTPENFSGVKAGISWFEGWQMTKGKDLEVGQMIENAWQNRQTPDPLKESPTVPPSVSATPPPAPDTPPAPPTPPTPPTNAKPPKPEKAPKPPSAPLPPAPPEPPREDN